MAASVERIQGWYQNGDYPACDDEIWCGRAGEGEREKKTQSSKYTRVRPRPLSNNRTLPYHMNRRAGVDLESLDNMMSAVKGNKK